jgi:hypothetical protein
LAATLQTLRGKYRLSLSGEPERSGADLVLTLTMERIDGIERVSFRCVIASAPVDRGSDAADTEKLRERMAPWVERRFEQLREAALKSVRSEGKLLEVGFETAD